MLSVAFTLCRKCFVLLAFSRGASAIGKLCSGAGTANWLSGRGEEELCTEPNTATRTICLSSLLPCCHWLRAIGKLCRVYTIPCCACFFDPRTGQQSQGIGSGPWVQDCKSIADLMTVVWVTAAVRSEGSISAACT